MENVIWWPSCNLFEDLTQYYSCCSGFIFWKYDFLEIVKWICKRNFSTSLIIHDFFVVLFILFHESFFHVLDLLFSQCSVFNTFLWIKLKNWRVIFNFLIHLWLCEKRLILLIMTKSSITNNIDENIFFKLLSIIYSNFHALV